MPRLRKVILNRTVVALTSSMEEGLYLPPNPLMNAIIEGQLARAQALHPVQINHLVFESNHFHMLATVRNPDDIRGFMERFKTETAHAINRLMGRQKRTIWCKGYDSPVVLTLEDVIDRIVYIYTNPAKDSLEESIGQYPGVSSFHAWQSGRSKRRCPWITRSMLRALPSHFLSQRQYAGLAKHLKNKASEFHTFEVFADSWMEVFGVDGQQGRQEVNKEIVRRIKEREAGYARERQAQGRGVVGAKRLLEEPMDKPYTPTGRRGRKMWCICRNKELRRRFVSEIKSRIVLAQEVYRRWRVGDYSVGFPAGLFSPSMPKTVEALVFC